MAISSDFSLKLTFLTLKYPGIVLHLVTLFLSTGSPYEEEKHKKKLADFNLYIDRELAKFFSFLLDFVYSDLEMTLIWVSTFLPDVVLVETKNLQKVHPNRTLLIFCDEKSKLSMSPSSKSRAWAPSVLII